MHRDNPTNVLWYKIAHVRSMDYLNDYMFTEEWVDLDLKSLGGFILMIVVNDMLRFRGPYSFVIVV